MTRLLVISLTAVVAILFLTCLAGIVTEAKLETEPGALSRTCITVTRVLGAVVELPILPQAAVAAGLGQTLARNADLWRDSLFWLNGTSPSAGNSWSGEYHPGWGGLWMNSAFSLW
ncbi:MAG: hypothetical protein FOGNACKC_00004 [Anaerolineae bacterium]|nr:hypothetical protein [Anaerolineae bacterium]